MKGTVHPRRLLLCLVLVPALLAGLGAWQSWRAEQQAERLGAAQQRVEVLISICLCAMSEA
ncbi:hypothetical protein DZ910_033760 [Pseudomonas aeruginosa]|nr:hypothetical protein [Pseudomonas aeruginosa]